MLRELADASSAVNLGLDLGGTLTKLVIASPVGGRADYRAAHADEKLRVRVKIDGGREMCMHFASTSTGELEEVLKALTTPDTNGRRRRHHFDDDDDDVAKDEEKPADTETTRNYLTSTIVEESPPSTSTTTKKDDTAYCRQIVAAGGGAHKLRGTFRLALGIELTPFREMQSIVDGLLLLHELAVEDEVYQVINTTSDTAGQKESFFPRKPPSRNRSSSMDADKDDEVPGRLEHMRYAAPIRGPADVVERQAAWPKPLLPLLLVNVGSGVSCLLVTREGYARIGGTAIGGATFLGLARALTAARTFEEAIALAAEGDAAQVDTLVEDIYGETGCSDLGLPPSLTAASFGKLSRSSQRESSDADVCRALLEMVAQSCCVLARAHAAQLGCRQRVFFAGGFVDNNPLARATIASSLRSLGGQAHFLRHSDFLGTSLCIRVSLSLS